METFETPQTAQTTEPKSYDWPKIILAAVFGFVLLAGAAYAGYWYGTESAKVEDQMSKPQLKTQDQEEPTPTPPPLFEATPTSSQPITDPTAGWKTYTNEKYGFQFRYPSDYSLFDAPLDVQQDKDYFLSRGLSIINRIYENVGQPPSITLDMIATADSVDVFIQKRREKLAESWEEFLVEFGGYENSTPPQIVSVTDRQGSPIQTKMTEEVGFPNAPHRDSTRFYFKNNGILFVLSARYGTYNPDTGRDGTDEKDVLDNIFSTFRFLD